MTAADDRRFMAMALSLGRRGLGRVWPRPSVGCVIVNAGRIVGRGHTDGQTGPHGEGVALAQAGAAAGGATVYVGLEPCAHHGKVPPCADALIVAGVARVVSAMEDPFPEVAGKGHARLRAAGVAVETGLLQDRARRDHEGFLTRVAQGRPMLTLKLAVSLDGRIATAAGESRWITGPEARARVHGMRASHDAVLVGGGTARADDPELTVRGLGVTHQPVRIVATRTLNLPGTGKLASSAAEVPLWIVHGERDGDAKPADRAFWRDKGARLIQAPVARGGHLDPDGILLALGAEGLTRVFCEGGGALAAALLQAGLVDRLVIFSAGLALGAEGWPGIGAMGIDVLAEAPRFTLVDCRRTGNDVMQTWERS